MSRPHIHPAPLVPILVRLPPETVAQIDSLPGTSRTAKVRELVRVAAAKAIRNDQ